MANPTPDEIIEIAKSGSTGQVKTLSDIRFEKLEKELADMKANYEALAKANEELRAANAELYSFASQVSAPASSSAPTTTQPAQTPTVSQPVAAAPVVDESAKIAEKQREEANLQAVLEQMGYKKPAAASQSVTDNTNTPKDGM